MERLDVIEEGKKKRYYIYETSMGRRAKYPSLGISGTSKIITFPLEIDDLITIGDGEEGALTLVVDECEEALELLSTILKEKNPQTFEEKCECVMEAINGFFGDIRDGSLRYDYYLDNGCESKLSSFAHKNMAACAERAVLSHILLGIMGIKSTIKISSFLDKDGKRVQHVYNLVEDDGRYFIFDATQPTLNGEKISPLVAEISEESYKDMHDPKNIIGLHVSHFNPMAGRDYDVVYNYCASEIREAMKPKQK